MSFNAKYRGSAHRDWYYLRLNHKIPIVFHDLKSYDSHLIMQEPENLWALSVIS